MLLSVAVAQVAALQGGENSRCQPLPRSLVSWWLCAGSISAAGPSNRHVTSVSRRLEKPRMAASTPETFDTGPAVVLSPPEGGSRFTSEAFTGLFNQPGLLLLTESA